MSRPDWNVAIIDGQPEMTVNLAAVAVLVKRAPVGEAEALRRMQGLLDPEAYAALLMEMAACRQDPERTTEACGKGVCAANAGHEGTCAEASGWED
ncbi:hypothetical protein [uncultured Arsenicicoccus sp.]|uniref:hypothetical protein n=1 Tax=uncultured Arsenicicoccus sp. TaxID=491339 RepID=UPI002597F715|nr:hypothetical protein [uncultured Arsenicicoccus sp.]